MNIGNQLRPWGVYAAMVLLMAVLLIPLGCGKKGNPVAPDSAPPPSADEVQSNLQDGILRLSWNQTIDKNISGYTVYRYRQKLTEPLCPGCPLLFERVADISVYESPAYTETLDKGYRYTYKVTTIGVDGLRSDAPLIRFDY